MSYWVEIHCNGPPETKEAVAPGEERIALFPRCHSENGAEPGGMAFTLERAAREARRRAKEAGWKLRRGMGWFCPHCDAVMRDTPPRESGNGG